ncbi:MAG TPA: glycine zipper family protein [Gammaproteobacteria bacterium]|nr:glycine zipper family protein [Gammaproteobacteria bacterium]
MFSQTAQKNNSNENHDNSNSLTQQDLINSISDPLQRRIEQARFNRMQKVAEDKLGLMVQPGELFDEAIEIINKTEILTVNNLMPGDNDRTKYESNKKTLIEALQSLKLKTAQDVKSNKLGEKDAASLENATRELVITGDVNAFKNTTNKFKHIKSDTVWKKILSTLIGAIVGFFAGLMLGAPSGPGAAFTAVAGGITGAIVGASIGTVTGAVTGYGLANFFKRKPEQEPLDQITSSASEIFSQGVELKLGA